MCPVGAQSNDLALWRLVTIHHPASGLCKTGHHAIMIVSPKLEECSAARGTKRTAQETCHHMSVDVTQMLVN